ncbi:hypothetical protein GUJ93_ZPchr0007g4670 [Zizania palustris]|uniref:Uncharacterized protein n=1 Tax=Zizania palustris TaxID=103762 RepID=A0A8J5VQN2_ZIZPA|nr:hypothetical protein GUJ93_ZPchr0007g4670 [Zizania palustris]
MQSCARRRRRRAGCGKQRRSADRARARELKMVVFFFHLVCSAIGCGLPVLGWRVPVLLRPNSNVFLKNGECLGLYYMLKGLQIGSTMYKGLQERWRRAPLVNQWPTSMEKEEA